MGFNKIILKFINQLIIFVLVSTSYVFAADDRPEPEIVIVPAHAADADWQVHVQVFKPEGNGPFPLIVFSHGRGKLQDRIDLKYPILRGHAAYWLRKGFAVVAPIRPGYGETGGADIETAGLNIRSNGVCSGTPDYEHVAETAADVVTDIIKWAEKQSWVNRKKVILVGQSVGGLTTVALGARNLSGVIGYINFAGGTGGAPDIRPMRSCFPELLTEVYAKLGKTTHIPNLWLYAKNDQYWGPDEPVEWHKAFAKAGGSGQFIQTEAVPNEDGHKLLAKGGHLWSDHVDPFIMSLGFEK